VTHGAESEHEPRELDEMPESGKVVIVGSGCSTSHARYIAREHGTDYIRHWAAPRYQAYLLDLDEAFKPVEWPS
jgi:hypothetical protein